MYKKLGSYVGLFVVGEEGGITVLCFYLVVRTVFDVYKLEGTGLWLGLRLRLLMLCAYSIISSLCVAPAKG